MHGHDVSLTEPLVWEEALDFVPRLPLDCLLLVFGSLPLSPVDEGPCTSSV